MASAKNAATTQLLEEFRSTMEQSQKDFVFACGGSLPHGSRTANIDPVTIRWDPLDGSTPVSRCKITFPAESQGLSSLIASMQQATFGLGGQDVMDETYRKALKLNTSAFSTNFCPYNAGIIDTISRLLVPGIISEYQTAIVKAELYKLNIYEGPSGHFRSHVDTPRSSSQFGSLVVCLPAAHSGGELVVRHNGKTMTFDWGSSPHVQWAAFYSDCEHEVLQVHSGQRVTLTYNLYACTSFPDHEGGPPGMTISQGLSLPLADYFRSALANKDFMPQGGHLGFYATHAYPHSSEAFKEEVNLAPEAPPLKGIDRALWQTAKALGCRVMFRPIVDFMWDGDVDYEEEDPDDDQYAEVWIKTIGRSLGFRLMGGRVDGLEDLDEVLESGFQDKKIAYTDFEWLNRPKINNREPTLAYTAYGNEASAAYLYTYCTILISIPAFDETTGARKIFDIVEETGPDTNSWGGRRSPFQISTASFGG